MIYYFKQYDSYWIHTSQFPILVADGMNAKLDCLWIAKSDFEKHLRFLGS